MLILLVFGEEIDFVFFVTLVHQGLIPYVSTADDDMFQIAGIGCHRAKMKATDFFIKTVLSRIERTKIHNFCCNISINS